jgi:hypothetical protein
MRSGDIVTLVSSLQPHTNLKRWLRGPAIPPSQPGIRKCRARVSRSQVTIRLVNQGSPSASSFAALWRHQLRHKGKVRSLTDYHPGGSRDSRSRARGRSLNQLGHPLWQGSRVSMITFVVAWHCRSRDRAVRRCSSVHVSAGGTFASQTTMWCVFFFQPLRPSRAVNLARSRCPSDTAPLRTTNLHHLHLSLIAGPPHP